jgi:hypothetical protein
MKPTRRLSRRSFLAVVAGGAATAGAVGLIAPGRAEAMQCTDADTGSSSDPAGRGRNCGGCSDSDSGPSGDPSGRGRRCGGNRVAPGQGINFQAPGNQVRVPSNQVQQMRVAPNGRQQFLYQGRWYNLIGNDGSTLVGDNGAS